MNVITHDHVSITDPTEPLYFYEVQIPKNRVLEAWFDNRSTADICRLAEEAAVYAYVERQQLVCTARLRQGVDTLLSTFSTSTGTTLYVVMREEPMARRPLMPAWVLPARFEAMQPTQDAMIEFLDVAKLLDYEVAAWRERRGALVPTGRVEEYLGLFRVDYRQDAHQLVRAHVIANRPGGFSIPLDFKGHDSFLSEDNDGTVAITRQVKRPWQGTLKTCMREYAKGIVRPPLRIGHFVEREWAVSDMSFDKIRNARTGDFHVLSHLPAAAASLNLQSVLFGAQDPAAVIRRDNERIAALDPRSMLSAQDKRKLKAGVPSALLFDQFAPWSWGTKFHIKGVRATVFGSPLVDRGCVAFLPQTYRKLRRFGQIEGGTICLHRDPALSNASSMHDFRVVGQASWDGGFDGAGIVLNPADPAWKEMGGDFDGDQAVAFIREFALAPSVPKATDYKSTSPIALVRDSIEDTVLGVLIDGLAPTLGPTVAAASRMAERGYLDTGARAFTADLTQGAVSAQKHAMRTRDGRGAYRALREFMQLIEPEDGYMTDAFRDINRASGLQAKQQAWLKLVRSSELERHAGCGLPIVEALAERVAVLHEFYKKIGWLRRDNVTLPEHMKVLALSRLREKCPDSAQQIRFMQKFRREWIALRRQTTALNEAVDDNGEGDGDAYSARVALNEKLSAMTFDLKVRIKQGTLDPLVLITGGTTSLAVSLVSAEVFESLDAEVSELFTGVRKRLVDNTWVSPVSNGTVAVRALEPHLFESNREKDEVLLRRLKDDPKARATVLVLKDNARSQQIHITW